MDPIETLEQEPIAEGEEAAQLPQTEATPESEAQSETPEKKPVDPVQKRINQLTWKAHEAERRLNAEILARQQVEQQAQALWQQQQEFVRRATMPTPEQVNLDPRQYQAAVDAHNQRFIEQQNQIRQAQWQRQQQAVAAQQFESRLQARVSEGAEKFADYNEVIGNPQLPTLSQVNPPLLHAILEHPQMPEITYYLGKNPGEAHRIAAMPSATAILEVGRIAAKLPDARHRSNAPAPPSTVGGNQRASGSPSDSDSMEAWLRKRNAQLRTR